MSLIKKADLLGYYVPSFFEMYVKTDQDDMALDKLPMKDLTTLFHEYIHFLQDFTTIYGLNGLYVHSEYIHSVANRIYALHSNEFEVPFQIQDNNDNVLLNREIKRFTDGDNSECWRMKNVVIIDDGDGNVDRIQTPNSLIHEVQHVFIQFNDEEYRSFGAWAIMENMAYLMERQCSSIYCGDRDEFPYRAAEKVADFIKPGFSQDPLMVLALCDMSLMTSNPGTTFVDTMKEIKNGHLSFKTPEEIYDYFYQQEVEMYGGERMTMPEAYCKFLDCVANLLKSYVVVEQVSEPYYRWIDRLVSFAKNWRFNDRYFLLKMAREGGDNLRENSYFRQAINSLGTPLMSNNHPGVYYKIPPEGFAGEWNMEFFKAIHEIENVFEEGSSCCSMTEWCSSSLGVTVDERCQTAPWERCSDPELCPFAVLWKHWKLCGRNPVKRKE